MNERRPYVRPMAGWWRRDRYFVNYMVREATSLLVAAYAVVLLVGVIRLGQGEAAFDGWLAALQSPASILFHAVVLATFVYHAWSWFRIMPKTLPILFVGGRRVAQATITRIGLAAAAASFVLLIALAAWGVA